ARACLHFTTSAMRPCCGAYQHATSRVGVLSLRILLPNNLRLRNPSLATSHRYCGPHDSRTRRDTKSDNTRSRAYGRLATHTSNDSIHRDSHPPGENGPELHGEPWETGRKANTKMAVADFIKSARESFWVGWKVESNWADPVLFATYRIVQPLASLLIVAFIVIIGASTGTGLQRDYLARLIVSTAFFVYVAQITTNMGWLVHTDRSRYEVLKNIYISPGTLHPYIIGRGLVSVVNATISVIVTLLFSIAVFNGILNLGIPINLLSVNLLLLAPTVLL